MPYDALADSFAGNAASALSPARKMALVTPNDSVDLALYAKALRVYVPSTITEASVVVIPHDNADAAAVTLKFGPGVWVEPSMVRRVKATGTTAGIEIHAYQG